jgi:hypothetical protein
VRHPRTVDYLWHVCWYRRAMTIPHPKDVLQSWSALVGIWGSSYFALLEAIDVELANAAESLEWPFVIIGLAGTGSVILTSWRASKRRPLRR